MKFYPCKYRFENRPLASGILVRCAEEVFFLTNNKNYVDLEYDNIPEDISKQFSNYSCCWWLFSNINDEDFKFLLENPKAAIEYFNKRNNNVYEEEELKIMKIKKQNFKNISL